MKNTNPFKRIYYSVSQIPKGWVSTYKEVARASGVGNSRIVGFALHANKYPKRVPCHRVVKSTGAIAKGYAFGGKAVQKKKLEEEGVLFLDNERVDLEKCLFKLLPHYLPGKWGAIGQESINL